MGLSSALNGTILWVFITPLVTTKVRCNLLSLVHGFIRRVELEAVFRRNPAASPCNIVLKLNYMCMIWCAFYIPYKIKVEI